MLRCLCLLAWLVMAVCGPASAQDWVENLCEQEPQTSTGPVAFTAAGEAQQVVALITKQAPVFTPVRAVVVERDPNETNAFAHHCENGQKLVVFNARFMERVRTTAKGTGPYWSWVFVAAHELGHIWSNHGSLRLPCTPKHPLDAYCPCRLDMPKHEVDFNRRLELEADYFAGYVLARLGASRDATLSAMHVLSAHDTCTHPSRASRAEVVSRGWVQAKEGADSAYTRGSKADLDEFHLLVNRDVDGGDYREVFGVSLEACAHMCLARDTCAVFSFDRWNNACFLKSKWKLSRGFKLDGFPESRKLNVNDRILKLEPKSTVGVRKSEADTVPGIDTSGRIVDVVLKDRYFYDAPQLVSTASEWPDCARKCREDASCIAFNFFEQTCEIFSRTDGHYPSPGRRVGYRWVQNR